jgi:molybdopterin molybdotransferase
VITYTEALAMIEALPLRGRAERAPLTGAIGRVLAEDVRLGGDQPPFDRATMDGFAVALAPGATGFRVVGTVAAGSVWSGAALKPGEAVRIMTGAPCPAGTTVVPIEVAKTSGDRVECEAAALQARRNIAWRGEDGHAGDVVLAAGTRLTPTTLAAAAMCGAESVAVHAAPRIGVVTTGDEVGGAGDGGIKDSNGPFLDGFAAALGCASAREHARDELEAVRATLRRARERSEVVVTTGGVSGSATDLVPAAAAAEGFATVFHHVAMQPGKPVLLARHADGQLLVGLPGNAVSVIATAHLFLLPALSRFLGGWRWGWKELPLAVARKNAGKRQQFLPARLVARGVEAVPWNGSGDLIAAAAGEGLIDLPVGCDFAAGATVRFLPYVGGAAGGLATIPPRAGR